MWVCLNNSFVSIVQDYEHPDNVLVRARRKSDLVNFLGTSEGVIQSLDRDYQFRKSISKFDLSKLLAKCADRIDYPNFKNSVKDSILERFFTEIWHAGVRNLDPGVFKRWIFTTKKT